MKKTIQVVGSVTINEMGQVLCALRSPTMSLPNMWEFPGGKIEEGESREETLVREIEEELHCTIHVHEQIAEVIHEYEQIIVHLVTYRTTIIEGQPRATEHAALQWVPLSELQHLHWAPADIPTVEALLANKVGL